MRFQQLTGPLMAKGVEDTALYRYLRLPAANEVGGDPQHLGADLGRFHHANTLRQRDWPATMLTTSTHDTKRSEDVRARLAVLSQIPDRWVRAVDDLRDGRRPPPRRPTAPAATPSTSPTTRSSAPGRSTPNASPPTSPRPRVRRSATRAGSTPAPPYEDDVDAFVRGVLADDEFLATLEAFLDEVVEAGRLTSLSQTLLKLTSPGIPDIYQGTELWDLSLVDPDNRRPVDLDLRHRLLAELGDDPRPDDLLDRLDEGLPKLWVTHRALQARRDEPAAFGAEAAYEAVHATGPREDHVVAFLRGGRVLPIAPRLVAALGTGFADWDWQRTTLDVPEGRWVDRLSGSRWTGGTLPLAELLATFPCALLVAEDDA